MRKPPHNEIIILKNILSRGPITKIRRRFYYFQGDVDKTNGPLELHFSDGSVLNFDSGPDGERLAIYEKSWEDPFREPLSPENRLFVATHGIWTSFDVSDNLQYKPFIGVVLNQVYALKNQVGTLAGLMVTFDSQCTLTGVSECDELFYVLESNDLQRLWADDWTCDDYTE